MTTNHQTGRETIHVGGQVPHFRVASLSGGIVAYATIWQRQILVLVSLLPDGPESEAYLGALRVRRAELAALDAACVITTEPIGGVPRPSVVVADRWGEVVEVAAADVAGLPTASQILASVEHVSHRCPECEGEAR